MRVNGYLQYIIPANTGEEFDDSGLPVLASPSWSDDLACFVQELSSNKKGKYQDGSFKQAVYKVLIEKPIEGNRVRLKRRNEPLGEYLVQSQNLISLDRVELLLQCP